MLFVPISSRKNVFLNELKKQKVKLTASQQMELLSLFNEQTNMIQDMTIKINSIHEKLDEKVFEICRYGGICTCNSLQCA